MNPQIKISATKGRGETLPVKVWSYVRENNRGNQLESREKRGGAGASSAVNRSLTWNKEKCYITVILNASLNLK